MQFSSYTAVKLHPRVRIQRNRNLCEYVIHRTDFLAGSHQDAVSHSFSHVLPLRPFDVQRGSIRTAGHELKALVRVSCIW